MPGIPHSVESSTVYSFIGILVPVILDKRLIAINIKMPIAEFNNRLFKNLPLFRQIIKTDTKATLKIHNKIIPNTFIYLPP